MVKNREILTVSLLISFFAVTCPAVEIATGKMLGKGYQERWFYVREGPRDSWIPTYAGAKYRSEAAGRLMNIRVAQGLFDDEWLTEVPFDPEANTDRLIAALNTYHESGVLAINVSLQGGNPGYKEAVPEIQRSYEVSPGRGKGGLISAFLPDGSLKPAWMGRLLRLQHALNERGMILDLMYFYQGQNGLLRDPTAVRQAVVNATDWLVQNDCRNVIIEIANESDWGYGPWIKDHLGDLIELARSRFKPGFRLPIGASVLGITVPASTRDHADLAIVHGNYLSPNKKRKGVVQLVANSRIPGPIYMNEDINERDTLTTATLAVQIASADAVWQSGGSWGYMPWRQVQMFPFRYYLPKCSQKLDDHLPLDERDQAYFCAVLEHIYFLVLK
jgi:hypothetical protein